MDGSLIKIVCNQNYNIDCDIHHTPLKFKCSLSTTLQNLRLAPRSSTCLHSCDRPFYFLSPIPQLQASARTAFRSSRPERLSCSSRRAYIPTAVRRKLIKISISTITSSQSSWHNSNNLHDEPSHLLSPSQFVPCT